MLLVPFLGERSGVTPRPAAHCPQQQEDLLDAWEQEDVEWGIVESLQELGELARTAGLQARVGAGWRQGSMRHFVFPPFCSNCIRRSCVFVGSAIFFFASEGLAVTFLTFRQEAIKDWAGFDPPHLS